MFDENIKFKYTWRDYQVRVLNKAQSFVDDGHIHVVAAPGSGKTVLGLELMRRINLPTIILAPTIAIRNQWAERFLSHFMDKADDEQLPDWLSLDANKPAKLTIITYQGLYSALAGHDYKQELEAEAERAEEENDDETFLTAPDELMTTASETIVIPGEAVTDNTTSTEGQPSVPQTGVMKFNNQKAAIYITALKELGIRTIIVDEAHHLRNDWWRSLNDLKLGLQEPATIALTATPPYDAEPSEWQKYQSFCGPIDIEVSVPELVARGDLCSHQDYVLLSSLSDSERQAAIKIKDRIKRFLEKLRSDEEFINALLNHPVVVNPTMQEAQVFDNPKYFTSIGSFLVSVDRGEFVKPLLEMICGHKTNLLPRFDEIQAEALLDNTLYHDAYFSDKSYEPLITRLRDAGSRAGVIEARQVSLTNNKLLAALLRNSISKLEAVRRIVAFEQATFKEALRCVILTDFIRREFLPPQTGALNKFGVVPIFETLRTTVAKTGTNKIGILSGVIVVIPEAAKQHFIDRLHAVANEMAAAPPKVSFDVYPSDSRFIICSVNNQTRQFIVRTITQLFENGDIQILVGTKSLLGEGWDAPAINSLVLASFVGSFMLSNQMRGRAIRTDKNQPNKVANIWHVATILPGASEVFDTKQTTTNDLGPEYNLLSRRFDTFVGINCHRDIIESGLQRALYLKRGPYRMANIPTIIEQANDESFTAASNKYAVQSRWERALKADAVRQLVHAAKIAKPKLPRFFVFGLTIKAAIIALITDFVTFMQIELGFLNGYFRDHSYADFKSILPIVVVIFIIAAIVTTAVLFRYILLAFKHFSPEDSIEQVGQTLLGALTSVKLINTPLSQLEIIADKTADGVITCGMKGGTTYENDLFLDCLEELLSPIDNPRYILQGSGKFHSFNVGYNNFSVPAPLAQRKESVLLFLKEWKKRVGPCRGVYTRTLQGRRLLLRARRESLSGRISRQSARQSVWE